MSEGRHFRRYTIVWIRIGDIGPHPKIQRAFDAAHARAIESSFDPDFFGELDIIEAPKGSTTPYWVFDGQHRHAAARNYLGEEQKVPCRLWDDIPLERQAQLFLRKNFTKAVRAIDKWLIRVLAREEIPLKVESLLARHRLRVSKTRGDGCLQAVQALETIYRRKGGEVTLDRVLTILGDAWGRSPDAYDALILRGLAEVVHRFGHISDKELARKLASKGAPKTLVGRARSIAQSMSIGPSRGMAQQIVNIYNQRLRSGRLEL